MKNNQVFINCPFDEEYKDILRALVFTLSYLGLTPKIASEFLNSAENRIEKICELINQSDYSIHDLSRCKSSAVNEYYRMNMPFEFGLDYGNSHFNHLNKRMLVLEGQRYDFQKTISDLSGVDTKCHNNEPEDVVRCIRNWLIEAKIINIADSPTVIWYRFSDFTSDFYDRRKAMGFTDKDLNDMPITEYIVSIIEWIGQNPFS
jgi:hypothetical protein